METFQNTCESFTTEDEEENVVVHSELKFRKKSIFVGRKTHFLTFSKVQKNIFCYFKNGKKSIFAPKKCLKL